jgi:hypothetical protein
MGCVQADYAGKPVIAVINTWSERSVFPSSLYTLGTDQRCVQSGPNVGKPGLNHMNL